MVQSLCAFTFPAADHHMHTDGFITNLVLNFPFYILLKLNIAFPLTTIILKFIH